MELEGGIFYSTVHYEKGFKGAAVPYATVYIDHSALGRFSMLDISTVAIVPVPEIVGDGNILPRAFGRRIVRHWHPLGCGAIELEKMPQGGCDGVIYTIIVVVYGGSLDVPKPSLRPVVWYVNEACCNRGTVQQRIFLAKKKNLPGGAPQLYNHKELPNHLYLICVAHHFSLAPM